MTLVDTSAWVEYDRATGSPADARLTRMIARDEAIGVTEPVMMEVLSGARTAMREHQLRRLLMRFHLLAFDSISDFDAAVQVYRSCRAAGVTPRGLIDCMIIAVGLRHGVRVLAHDLDFARAARVVDLDLDPASLAASKSGR